MLHLFCFRKKKKKNSPFVVMHLSYLCFYCSKHQTQSLEKLHCSAVSPFRVWCCQRHSSAAHALPFCVFKISHMGPNMVSEDGGKTSYWNFEPSSHRLIHINEQKQCHDERSVFSLLASLVIIDFLKWNFWVKIVYTFDFSIKIAYQVSSGQ